KVTLRFRGREMTHINYSKQILDSFFEKVEDIAVVDKPPKMEGRSMVMFLSKKR
ncbi:MAG: translation initiation factor IF-3 C-terminal domain-containing protein, partial [Clostridium sp.]